MIFSRFLFVEEFEDALDLIVLDDEILDFVEDHLAVAIDEESAYSSDSKVNGFSATRMSFIGVDKQARQRIVRAVRELKEETLYEIWQVNNDG